MPAAAAPFVNKAVHVFTIFSTLFVPLVFALFFVWRWSAPFHRLCIVGLLLKCLMIVIHFSLLKQYSYIYFILVKCFSVIITSCNIYSHYHAYFRQFCQAHFPSGNWQRKFSIFLAFVFTEGKHRRHSRESQCCSVEVHHTNVETKLKLQSSVAALIAVQRMASPPTSQLPRMASVQWERSTGEGEPWLALTLCWARIALECRVSTMT